MVKSYLESNKEKKEKVNSKELKEAALKAKEKFEKFYKLVNTQEYKECKEFLKEEIYDGLNLAPGDSGDWWLKYCWGLKACLSRIDSHAKKYEDAIEYLSK